MALGVLAWMAVRVGAVGSFEPQVTVTLRIPDAAGLQVGAAVRVAGVEVGQVADLALDHDVAVATLRLDVDAGLRRDIIARIRARSVLGEKYVELAPVSRDAALLADEDTLTVAAPQVEIDEMVGAIGPLLDAVDAEQLGQAVDAIAAAIADDPERASRMLGDLEAAIAAGREGAERVPALLDHAEDTLSRVDRLAVALEARAAEARRPLAEAGALVDDLRGLAGPLRETVDEARGTLGDARSLLAGFEGIDAQVRTVLDQFAGFDKWEMRRLLREEGILIRVREKEVVVPDTPDGR